MDQQSKLIHIISRASKDGDLLLDFMDKYHLAGLRYASVEQLKEYINVHKLNCGKEVKE